MRRVVVDASALVELLLRTPRGVRLEAVLRDPDADLHVPALCDVEVAAVLRRALLGKRLGIGRPSTRSRTTWSCPWPATGTPTW